MTADASELVEAVIGKAPHRTISRFCLSRSLRSRSRPLLRKGDDQFFDVVRWAILRSSMPRTGIDSNNADPYAQQRQPRTAKSSLRVRPRNREARAELELCDC